MPRSGPTASIQPERYVDIHACHWQALYLSIYLYLCLFIITGRPSARSRSPCRKNSSSTCRAHACVCRCARAPRVRECVRTRARACVRARASACNTYRAHTALLARVSRTAVIETSSQQRRRHAREHTGQDSETTRILKTSRFLELCLWCCIRLRVRTWERCSG